MTLALCHNVTPTYDDDEDVGFGEVTYQAASPDEIAIVKFCELVGLKLYKRDRHSITLLHVYTNKFWNSRYCTIFHLAQKPKEWVLLLKTKQGRYMVYAERCRYCHVKYSQLK